LVGEVDLVWGGDREIADDALAAVAADDPAARGRPRAGSLVGLAVVGGPAPVSGHPAQVGGAAYARVAAGSLHVGAELVATTGQRSEVSGATVVRQGRAALGVFGVRRLARVDLSAGAGVAAVGTWQWVGWRAPQGWGGERASAEVLQQLAPAVWGGGELRVPLAFGVGLDVGVRTHLVRMVVNHGVGLHLQGEARAGVSVAW
jgi:hypothetical protein